MERPSALQIEAAESQYLRARVAGLAALPGNPYQAVLSSGDDALAFAVAASGSPMLNRVCGDSTAAPRELARQLQAFERYNPALAVVGRSRQMPATLNLAGLTLAKLRGWTHLQLACSLEAVHQAPPDVEIQPVTAATLAAFAALHAEGFHRDPAVRAVNEASFSGLLEDPRARLSLLYAEGRPVAGAALFCASNGVAYLGTAFTSRAARGQGFHQALIGHRLAQARERGCLWAAATALPTSKSRRNLERCGLHLSHVQALYGRVAEA